MGESTKGPVCREPGVTLEQPAQDQQRVHLVLARGRDVGAHGKERLRAMKGAPAAGDLLLQLHHPQVALCLIVRKRHAQVDQEPAHLVTVGIQPSKQVGGG